jgi:MFS transporter, DHA1 family, inner membrane transport protein
MSSTLQDTAPARAAIPLPLLALALAAFAIGTTEFVIVGLLPSVAADTGTSLSQAGLLVTGYALGVAIGAPPLAALTARAAPYKALSGLMLLFILGNAMCAAAPGYGWLMAGRIVASLTHGAFFGLGATVAAALVPPQRRSAAIALMFSGLTLANMLGGWAADRWPVRSMFAILVSLAAVELALHPRQRGRGLAGRRGAARWARPFVASGAVGRAGTCRAGAARGDGARPLTGRLRPDQPTWPATGCRAAGA